MDIVVSAHHKCCPSRQSPKHQRQQKLDAKLCHQLERKPGTLRGRGKSSAAEKKTTEDDILRLRKRKLQLENVKRRLEIKKLRKDLEN